MFYIHAIGLIVLLIMVIYLISRIFGDHGFLPAFAMFLFGPFVAWIYILIFSKDKWPKKIAIFLIYYVAIGITANFMIDLNAKAVQLREEANEETSIEQNFEVNVPEFNIPEQEDPEFSTEPSE